VGFFWTIVVLVVALRSPGGISARTWWRSTRPVHFFGFLERPIYRALGTSPEKEQNWKRYGASMIIFTGVSLLVTYALLRIQGHIGLFNPQHLSAVPSPLAFNTDISFITNTNWQNYGGETTMSYFSQIGALTVQQFMSAAVGMAVAVALIRGFARKSPPRSATSGSTRCEARSTCSCRSPSSPGSSFVGQGAVQTLAGPAHIHDALNGVGPEPSRSGRSLHGGIQASLGRTVVVLQRQLGPPVRESDGPHQPALNRPLALHPLRLHLRLRQDGGLAAPGHCGARGPWWALRRLGGLTAYAEHQPTGGGGCGPGPQPTGNTTGKEVRFGDTLERPVRRLRRR